MCRLLKSWRTRACVWVAFDRFGELTELFGSCVRECVWGIGAPPFHHYYNFGGMEPWNGHDGERDGDEDRQLQPRRMHPALAMPEIVGHIMKCLGEEGCETAYCNGAHLVSWTWNAAFFRHAPKVLSSSTITRYMGGSLETLLGPGGARGWRWEACGNVSTAVFNTQAPECCIVLASCAHHLLPSLTTIEIRGTDSLQMFLSQPMALNFVNSMVTDGRVRTVRVGECMEQATALWCNFFAGGTYAAFFEQAVGNVTRLDLGPVSSSLYACGIIGMFSGAKTVRITMDPDTTGSRSAADEEKAVVESLRAAVPRYYDRFHCCDSVRVLEIDGEHGVCTRFLRDMCTDWVARSRARDRMRTGVHLYDSARQIVVDLMNVQQEALGGTVLRDEVESLTCPRFPMRCVQEVQFIGPVWRVYCDAVFMPDVCTVSFNSIPFQGLSLIPI